uniref:disintegrin and metalloproteinase domain-containing protein 5-like isoform X6 n=1 Tax=Halichoerus grypus TaxID=9711 RepID=UPI001659507A|nr:disintegrin and metalloproteinase domain-containing protein 5-like isoform X6 [Halichoerus grypus]XP_035974820.1 disintegrin and metalloproteinase domain-containing protein 5-like isoform X6 [Halichoerus grypus]
MFLLLVLLTRLGELHAGSGSHKTFLQTTVPEKISSSDAKGNPENNVAYIITIKGKPYFVHLTKQTFLSSVSVVYSYDKDDTQHSQPLLVQMDCSYHGYVAGFPNSLVSLHTCSGLRGTLQLKNISYGIEPMEAVSGFVHMIYEEKYDNTSVPLLGETKTYSYNNTYYHIRKNSERTEFFKLRPQYVEIYIVVDKNLNILPEMPVYKQGQRRVCGNGQLEQGEQCDCGSVENCTHKDCCDPRICVKKKGKQCGSGECCTLDCKLKPLGIQCRKSLDECDFPEYCDGVSSHCVPDTYARDGQSCDSGDAFCYGGRCRIHSKQCKDLIGGASRGGPFACYDEVNTRGDRYGNCGRDFCSYPNLLCGKLVCAWPHKALISRANLSVIYTHVREEMCVTTFRITDKKPKNTWTTFQTPEDRDDTFVQDGTVCGPAMYCLRFVCVEVQYQITNEECNSTYCNSHGVCNNLDHCHCDKGFDPPTCVEKKGEFGSIDDGHKAPSDLCQKKAAVTASYPSV